jgi:hypothetical protein
MRFPESADTRIWFTPEALLLEQRYDIDNVRPTCSIRAVPADVDDATLGAEIARMLTSVQRAHGKKWIRSCVS